MRLGLVFLVLAACVDTGAGPQPKRIDPGYVGKHLLTAPPALPTRVEATIGGKVIYLGNSLGPARLAPGQPIKVTHYWKVISPPGPNWRVFVLLRGAPNTADFMTLPITDMQRAHGPATWRAGEIIEDEQDILLRPDWRSSEATMLVGLIAVGEHGTLDRMPATGPNTTDNAVIGAKVDVDLSKAPPPPGTIHIPHAQGAITIDGTPSDPGWIGAVQSPDFATAEGSPDPIGKTTARMVWDEQYLYVYANIVDTDILSDFKNQDDPLWKADALELFIDADSNKRGYVELQVNPNNATFDSWFATTRAQPGDEAWDSGMLTAVKLTGSAAAGDSDTSWEVELAIPWAAIKGRDDAMNVNTPPHVGDRWRMNLVRADYRTANKSASASSWNRITYADWHAMDRMLTVVFADTLGGVVPNSPVDPRVPPADPAQGGSAAGSATGSAGSAAGSAAPTGPMNVVPATRIAPNTGSNVAAPNAGSNAPAPNAGSNAPPTPPASKAAPNAGSASTTAPALKAAPNAGSASTAPSSKTGPNAGSASTTAPSSKTGPNAGSASTTAPVSKTGPNAGSASTTAPALKTAPASTGSPAPAPRPKVTPAPTAPAEVPPASP